MSGTELSELLLQLERIQHEPSTLADKSSKLQRVVLLPYDGDFCGFLLSILSPTMGSATASQTTRVLALSQDCAPAAISMFRSPQLLQVLSIVKSLNHTPLLIKFIEYFNTGVEHLSQSIADAPIQAENIQYITEFASECIPSADSLDLAEYSAALLDKLIKQLPTDVQLSIIQTIYKSSDVFKQRGDHIVLMRYLTFFGKLCSGSGASNDAFFEMCSAVGAVQDTISLCQSTDVLLQMTALELLPDLAESTAGLDHFSTNNVISWLIVASCGSGPEMSYSTATTTTSTAAAMTAPDQLIASQAMRILGQIFSKAAARGFDLTRRVAADSVLHFMRSVYTAIEEGEEAEQLAGLVVTADLARISVATLQMVVESDVRIATTTTVTTAAGTECTLLNAWMGLLRVGKAELNAAVLTSVAAVLDQTEDCYNSAGINSDVLGSTVFTSTAESKSAVDASTIKEKVVALKRRIFTAVGQAKRQPTISYLLKTAKQPIESVRHAAVDLLRAVAAQRSIWGLQQLFPTYATDSSTGNEFLHYLLDRTTEYCKIGKDWKFSLIAAVATAPAKNLLSADITEKIDLMMKQGPYYMPALPEVLTADL